MMRRTHSTPSRGVAVPVPGKIPWSWGRPLPADADFQQLGDALGGNGLREVKALGVHTPKIAQQAQLLLRLDTLRDRYESETANEPDDRSDQLQRTFPGVEHPRERSLELDAGARQAVPVA